MKRNIVRQVRRDLEQIKYLLEQKADENISMKDFCRMHGISAATYYNWNKRTAVNSEKITTSFITGVIKDGAANDMPFVEIEKRYYHQTIQTDACRVHQIYMLIYAVYLFF